MTRIYQLGHRETTEPYWIGGLYDAVQVGTGVTFLPHRDSECENSISDWNRIWCEETGVKWVYEAGTEGLDYVGVCQYRRRLKFSGQEEVENIFKDFDVIVAKGLRIGLSPYEQYCHCHCAYDMVLAEAIVKEKYPQYADAWDAHMLQGRIIYYSSSYVMRKEDFNAWCEFFFGFGEEFLRRRGWDSVAKAQQDIQAEIDAGYRRPTRGLDYQSEILGFLAERLLTMWIRGTFAEDRIKEWDYYKLENV